MVESRESERRGVVKGRDAKSIHVDDPWHEGKIKANLHGSDSTISLLPESAKFGFSFLSPLIPQHFLTFAHCGEYIYIRNDICIVY